VVDDTRAAARRHPTRGARKRENKTGLGCTGKGRAVAYVGMTRERGSKVLDRVIADTDSGKSGVPKKAAV